jgi:hypothetical protein
LTKSIKAGSEILRNLKREPLRAFEKDSSDALRGALKYKTKLKKGLMRKFINRLLKKLLKIFDEEEAQTQILVKEEVIVTDELPSLKVKETQGKNFQKKKKEIIHHPENPIRDVIDLMEFPFVALSKDRRNPIIYESADGTQKVKITRHTGHFLASIYDWDIILIVAGKIQEILNNGSDIPSCTISIPRHEL